MSLDIRPPRRVRPLTKKTSLPLRPVKHEVGVNKPALPRKKAENGQLKWAVIVAVVIVLLLIGIVMIRKLEQSEVYYSLDRTSQVNSLTKDKKRSASFDQQRWRQDFSSWQKDFNRWQKILTMTNQLMAEIDDLGKVIIKNEKQGQK